MDFKVIALIACFALVNGAVLPETAIDEKLENYDSHPSYKFSYNVQDELTGDFKSQTEIRDGDLVQGEYSLREADGSVRTVEYTADAENGFKAHVRRGPAEVYKKQALVKMTAIELPKVTSPSPALPQISTTPIAIQSTKKDTSAVKTYVQPAAYIRTYTSPTLVHHQPSVIHAPPATVHLTPTTHFVHTAPAATALLKTAAAPAVIAHHTPTVLLVHPSEDGMKEEETNYVNELMFLSVFINCSFRPSYILMLFRQTPELHFDFDRFMLSFAFVNAGVIHPAPVVAVGNVEEYDPHPQYTYGYDVKDALSGDSKTAVESRDGHVVRGQYSLNDADGYRRIVDYTADPVNGFNAIVRREPLVAAIPAAPVVAPHAHVAVAPVAVVPVPKAVAPLIASPAFVKTTFASPHITYQNPSYRNVKWNKV
uniref:Uncharacterized protein n=1 Tax=Glossina brevipalpis TaxID=37001 RepID=A0A1A9W4I5_9MUSC